LPEVAVILSGVVDTGAELLAVSVSTLVEEAGLVPHEAVTPVGSDEATASVTLPLNLPASLTEMVVELDFP